MAEPAESREGPLVGRYALHGEIAAGGMATVHFGRFMAPAGFRRIVAVKRLHPQLALDPDFVSMFFDEVRLAARIQHPNVVGTLDAVDQDGELFLIMEYVHGEALSRLMRLARVQGQPVPVRFAATILCDVLHGLHAAHEATSEFGEPLAIVHRDVSPQNVMVGRDGVSRVLDFGIAKAAGRIQTTRAGQVKGKMAYLAPENVHGGAIDRRSDIYGAAVVLWEAVTGVRLFDGDNDAVVLAKVLEGDVPPLALFVDKVPAGLQEIVSRGLDRDPERRFATAREMALALHERVGIAPPSEVGDWVGYLAEENLTVRAQYIAALEQVATPRQATPSSEPSATRRLELQLARQVAPRSGAAVIAPRAASGASAARPAAPPPLVTTLLLGSVHHKTAAPGNESATSLVAPRSARHEAIAAVAHGAAIAHYAAPMSPAVLARHAAPADHGSLAHHDARPAVAARQHALAPASAGAANAPGLAGGRVTAHSRASALPGGRLSGGIAVATALFLVLGIAGLGWSRASRPQSNGLQAPAVSVENATAGISAPLPSLANNGEQPPVDPPAAAPLPSPMQAATPTHEARVAGPAARPSPPSAAVSSGSPAPRSAVSGGRAACRPPYLYDGNGIKHFKVECL